MDRTAMLTSKLEVVLLLNVWVSLILAAGDEVYGLRGGAITLSPGSLSGPLERIVWKHGDHKAIEWEGDQTDAYRQFKGSTFVDAKTGEMMITKLDSRFNGVYSSDVNGVQATKTWKLTVLDPVSKPITKVKCNESMCELSCKNEATVKVQCAWRKGEEELRQSDGTLKLEKTDGEVGKAYICNCSSPVSSAVSDQIVPFPPDPVSKPSIHKECHESTCELSCKNEPTVEVQCAWRKGEEELQKYDRTLKLEKTDGEVGKAYTCNCSNSVSFAVSDPVVPFPPETPVGLAVGLGVLFTIIIIIIIIGVTAFRKKLRRNDAAANQRAAKDTSPTVPLKVNAADNQDGANETSQAEPIYVNAADNQDGANETSQDMPLNGDTRC